MSFLILIPKFILDLVLTSLDLNEKEEMRGRLGEGTRNATTEVGKKCSRDRKLALQQDVERLKKKLRHEENIHKALKRAFNRPLGSLPRIPPYLPPNTLGLVAEVAVLEEEIVRLEEQVVHYRQDLYQEAVKILSSKMKLDNASRYNSPKLGKLKSLSQTNTKSATFATSPTTSLPVDRQGKEDHSYCNPSKRSKQSTFTGQATKNSTKKLPNEHTSLQKSCGLPKRQQELWHSNLPIAEVGNLSPRKKPPGDESPNIISENILKCLSSILLRMSGVKNPGSAFDRPVQSSWDLKLRNCIEGREFRDPYGNYLEFGKRDIGLYKQLLVIEAKSFNPKRTSNSLFLLHRLKLLLRKLAFVNLDNLNHQEKLAFWINIYNSCMMNAFIENGMLESTDVVALTHKATINVGGNLLSATTIEHCILRLPCHWKFLNSEQTLSKEVKNHEMTLRSLYGLELYEPLVIFALSCGTWSSPAVRVYAASQVEYELEVAKREYLQAAVGISKSKFRIPELLDWHLLELAKDLESLLDWICIQLPSETGQEAIKFLEKRNMEPLSQFVQIMPYDFRFRYLLCR
ncbi:unnamed protein product [Lupinus luteus]|uniref:Ternary complex factor MIP1, leucine-zipper n=1 Tax=Lupinus luteus TaxID=3873 RepID=A0AAV1XBB5_LUPLU